MDPIESVDVPIGASRVRVAHYGHTAILTIERPEVLNAIDRATSEELGAALEEAGADPEVRAVVLTGAGDRAFSAGADLKALSRGELPYAANHPGWGFAGVCRHVISKPMIAAVNGLALGGGLELVLACDLVVAHGGAKVGLPEVRRGIMASGGGALRLSGQIPQKVAMGLILTGEETTMAELARWGLVTKLVEEQGDVVPQALELAERVCRNAPLAVQASKRVALGVESAEKWEANDAEAAAVRATADAAEGPNAFLEKRAPQWTAS